MTGACEHAMRQREIIPNAFQKLRRRRERVVVPRKDGCPEFKDALHVAALDDPQVQGCYEAPGPVGVTVLACGLLSALLPGVPRRLVHQCACFGLRRACGGLLHAC